MNNRRGMGLIAVLIAVLIVGLLYYFMVQNNKKDNPNKSFVESAGVDTSSYGGILNSTRKIVNAADEQSNQ